MSTGPLELMPGEHYGGLLTYGTDKCGGVVMPAEFFSDEHLAPHERASILLDWIAALQEHHTEAVDEMIAIRDEMRSATRH
jgi:hypothetical protein